VEADMVRLQSSSVEEHLDYYPVRYGIQKVGNLEIFYREAGDPHNPAVVLLHGFPTSSHMYREVLHALADKYYLIAPDYPGFGESSFPSSKEFSYTFDNLASVIEKFLEVRGLKKFVLMIQDYGAPIGLRIAAKHPEKIRGLVIQNGNAYVEGFGDEGWNLIFKYWKNKSSEIERKIIKQVFSLEGLKWQYTHGTRNPLGILPDNWNLDFMKLSRPGQYEVQLALFYDYQNNLKHYPDWQKFFRDHQPPALIVWGKNDAFFPVSGAEAYKRDLKNLDYNILDTGHFALEEEASFILKKMRAFLGSLK
jgi:pimeloyl-ACP methyl ester carboxylesterase